ncbi:MAG: hypothetical protein J0M11_00570 [Anaerolineae bacterium]|nr:hypothetical protein [Anaerolineae bacterium]
MLKPMKPKSTFPKNIFLWILVGVLVLSGIIALVAAFNGGDDAEADVNAVYTNAAATVAAQQLTLQASAPSATPTLAFTPTATFTVAPLASPTLFTNLPIASNTSSAPSGAVGCNNSAYVADVTFPDDTVVTPGQTFTKTWKLQNTGSCPWTTAYKVSFVSGNAMGGVATPLTVTVAPGASGDVSVAMTAPATAGDAIGYWILTNDSGQNFGTSFYVKVKVGGTAITGTPGTVTATSTSSVSTPVAANNPVIVLTCTPNGTQYEYTGQLTWEDKSNNEQGFNIYVGGILADIAPADTTSYQVKVNGRVTNVLYDANTPITYSVEAFNAGGKASQANVIGQCP